MNSPASNSNLLGMQIRVRGTVQGVGFRPYIAQLATQHSLLGDVLNDANGVLIHVWGEATSLDAFINAITNSAPPLAVIDQIESQPLNQSAPTGHFQIKQSKSGHSNTDVSADANVCQACLTELFDPTNRRFHYPFINCTHCGPRFSIIRKIPYDRESTSMSVFAMCDQCEQEYHDPTNRRFHAQANACAACGPHIWLEDNNGNQLDTQTDSVMQLVAQALQNGNIVAVKGLGGFHLACDARNKRTVDRLRHSKRRQAKPLAMMARDIQQLSQYVLISEQQQQLLLSPQAPIVLMQSKANHDLADSVAPDQNQLGFMLPNTPLHHLLMQLIDFPIVLTSGNHSDTPQYIDNDDAKNQLSSIADLFLLHNRDIVNRVDDSLVKVMADKPRLLRRGRAYTPASFNLHIDFVNAPPVLAMGAELKSTFCLLRNGQAIVSQHIGDLHNQTVLDEYCRQISLYQQLYDFRPQIIATDLHPDYISSQYAEQLAKHFECNLSYVQHHHAHIAAVMAEHKLGMQTQVIGLAVDGLGMGTQEELWGAEIMLASYTHCQRLASIEPTALIGSNQAMYQPWRNLYAHLHAKWDEVSSHFEQVEAIRRLTKKPLTTIDKLICQQINSPKASSLGRVFDAVAAALGICFEQQDYEGQAAMMLEALASDAFSQQSEHAYQIEIDWQQQPARINWNSMWQQLLMDLANQQNKAAIAARFHHGLIDVFSKVLNQITNQHPNLAIVLSGGVMQNTLLHEGLTQVLQQQNEHVISSSLFAMNDGAISLGQAVITAAQQSLANNKASNN